MTYSWNRLSFDLPERIDDETVLLFTDQRDPPRYSLTVTRDALGSGASLGAYAVDGNRGNGTAHLFLARGAVPVGDGDSAAAEVAESDDLEDQELLLLTRDEVREALLAGEFKVAPWAAAVALALATD